MSARRTPGDFAASPLGELLDTWQRLLFQLVNARHDVDERHTPAELSATALQALAAGQALAEHVTASRWVTATDALRAGASLASIAAAMGVTEAEIDAGLMSWLHGQRDLFERSNGTLGVSEPDAEQVRAAMSAARTPVRITAAELADELRVPLAQVEDAVVRMVAAKLFGRDDVTPSLTADAAATVRLLIAEQGESHGRG